MKLPRDVKGVEAARSLQQLGYVELWQSGSHLIVRKDIQTAVVPQHKALKSGTLKGIIEQAGVSLEAFLAEL